MSNQKNLANILFTRSPIVTILGHVDHGKTTLLDIIRKTNLTSKEHGGITQHIGAYQINLEHRTNNLTTQADQEQRRITFIDTPGHEAFAKMRARGAKVADIAILVVAANDGVMPQTIESINHIKEAKIPSIVALNKIDLPIINLDKVKKQLVKAGLSLEEYGGDSPVIAISAKTGQGVDKLLETILLISDIYQIGQGNNSKLEAVVIESSLSKSRGIVATIIIRSGNLEIGQELVCGEQSFRVRAIRDFNNNNISNAVAGDPAELLGWQKLPPVGEKVLDISQTQIIQKPKKEIQKPIKSDSLLVPQKKELDQEKIQLIIRADTAGSLEALTTGISDKLDIISSSVGNITESDVLFAKTTGAIIVGFHTKPTENVLKLAGSEKVLIKIYDIIYELFDELDEAIETIKKGELTEILGEAKVVAIFPIKDDLIAGVKVVSGRIARGDKVKVVRNNSLLGKAKIKSLKQHKVDITKAEQGNEAGVLLSEKFDFLTGDSIISIG